METLPQRNNIGSIKQSLGRAASQQNIINSHNRTLSTEEHKTPLIHTTEHYLQKSTEHLHYITVISGLLSAPEYKPHALNFLKIIIFNINKPHMSISRRCLPQH